MRIRIMPADSKRAPRARYLGQSNRYPLAHRRRISLHEPFEFGDLIFEVFPIEHSIRVPAVGYQIRYESIRLIYVPDVESIPEAPRVVAGVDLYIGDGATIARPLLRKRGNTLLGHAPITIQLKWCQRERVHRAIFTHCGSQIVAGDERRASDAVRELGEEHGVEAALAYDGFELSID